MKFFDANVCYGPQKVGMPDVDYSLSALLHRMEEYRIEKALVLHSVAREHDAAFGNARLMNEIKGFGQLIPVWAVMPHHTGEMDAPDVLTEKMVSSGVKAAALFPSAGAHNFSLKRWSAGPLLDALAERRIPVLLGSEQVGGMEGLCEFALAYPKLTVIALNVNYRADRILFPAMEAAPNLILETSTYKTYFGLQEFVKRFGAERLVFGSGMPAIDPAASVSVITWSGLPQAQQEMIAHENLEQIIGEVR